MIIAIVALAIIVSVPLVGGHYTTLAQLRLRGTWLVAGSLAIQIAIISVFDLHSERLSAWLHIVTYAMIGICIALNRSVRWLWIIAVGWASNLTAIAANGGVMPSSTDITATIGHGASNTFKNSAPIDNARFGFLGDNFITPQSIPMRNVFSIGDIVLLIGLLLVTVAASRPPT